jgi:hypothetical protein
MFNHTEDGGWQADMADQISSLSALDIPCGDARSGRKIGGGCCPLTPSKP